MKFINLAAAAALALAGIAAPALAQNTAGVTAGATVYGPDGNAVGTIDRIDGGNAVIKSDVASAALPLDKFGKSDKGITISLTKAQFDAAAGAAQQQSSAALTAALVAGTDIYSSDGQMIGKVKSVAEDGSVVVTATAGEFTAKKEQVAMNGDKLTFLATKADIDAALAKQG